MIRGQVRSVSQICGFCEGNQHEIIVLSEGLCILIQMYREIVHISMGLLTSELNCLGKLGHVTIQIGWYAL